MASARLFSEFTVLMLMFAISNVTSSPTTNCPLFDRTVICSNCPVGETCCADNAVCISEKWRCDHVVDCDDNSDECDCVCDANDFKCAKGGCIDKKQLCDGHEDCHDGSDEFMWYCQDIDDCDPDPCIYGHCLDRLKDYFCDCERGYIGKDCGQNIDDCFPNPCLNGATCIDALNDYSCTCPIGWTGDHCETNIDECQLESDDCNDNADCKDTDGSYDCHCDVGYDGNGHGQNGCVDINECIADPSPCDPNADCTNNDGSYSCECQLGFVYDENEQSCTDIDECTVGPYPCDVNAACTNNIGSFSCQCNSGYSGDGLSCTSACIPGPMGMETGTLQDSQLSVSSQWSDGYSKEGGRLRQTTQGAWRPNEYEGSWYQVDFLHPVKLTGIETQGDPIYGHWVSELQVQTGDSEDLWTYITNENGEPLTFAANTGNIEIASITFPEEITARYIRILPISWNTHGIGLRMEVIGCELDECATDNHDCDENAECINNVGSYTCICIDGYNGNGITCTTCNQGPLGMESGEILDSQLSVSAVYATAYAKEGARLNQVATVAWLPPLSGQHWFQVYFIDTVLLTGIQIQGDPIYNHWIQTLQVQTGFSEDALTYIVDVDGGPKTFTGSTDRETIVNIDFPYEIMTTYIRILPITAQYDKAGLRLEVIGCRDGF